MTETSYCSSGDAVMSWCSTKAFPRRVSEISPPKLLLFTWDLKKHAGVTWHRLIIEMLRAGRARVTGVPWRSSKEMRCRFKPRTSRKLVQMNWHCHVSCEFIVKETYRQLLTGHLTCVLLREFIIGLSYSCRWGCDDRRDREVSSAAGPERIGGRLFTAGGIHGLQYWSPLCQVIGLIYLYCCLFVKHCVLVLVLCVYDVHEVIMAGAKWLLAFDGTCG